MKQLARAHLSNRRGEEVDARFNVLNRWTFLMMQAFESKRFLDLAESTHVVHPKSSLDEVLTQQALFRAFLLAYGKCFSASGKGRSSLDPKKVYAGDQRFVLMHDRVMGLRHKFAAHNDASGLDEALLDVQEMDDEFRISHRYAVANPLNEYSDFRQLIAALEGYIVTQTNRTLDSLEKTLGKRIRMRNENAG